MRSILGLALLLAALAPAACDDTTTTPEPGPYLEPTSPENMVQNLVTAYERQDIDGYAKCLASDFVFKFQQVDVQQLGLDTWNRDQDSTGTGALFGTPLVGDIRIDLIHAQSTVSAEVFPGVEGEVRFIRINPTQLEVDQIGGGEAGTTFRVDGDIQDMFFRRGNASADENTAHWFLFEWRDLPDPSGTGAKPDTPLSVEPTAVEDMTWGRIKTMFGG